MLCCSLLPICLSCSTNVTVYWNTDNQDTRKVDMPDLFTNFYSSGTSLFIDLDSFRFPWGVINRGQTKRPPDVIGDRPTTNQCNEMCATSANILVVFKKWLNGAPLRRSSVIKWNPPYIRLTAAISTTRKSVWKGGGPNADVRENKTFFSVWFSNMSLTETIYLFIVHVIPAWEIHTLQWHIFTNRVRYRMKQVIYVYRPLTLTKIIAIHI